MSAKRRHEKLSTEKRVQVLKLLVEGMSLRATSRATGAAFNTVTKLLTDAAVVYHAQHTRGIKGRRHIQCDELGSFVHCKEAQVPVAKAPPPDAGDCWTFTALDSASKLLVSYLVGPRNGRSAVELMDNLRGLLPRPTPAARARALKVPSPLFLSRTRVVDVGDVEVGEAVAVVVAQRHAHAVSATWRR